MIFAAIKKGSFGCLFLWPLFVENIDPTGVRFE
jgi:hypothetical protein